MSQVPTQGERDRAMSYLHATRKQFLDLTAAASAQPAQWSYRPAPDRWSLAEVAEHLAVTEEEVFANLQKTLAAPPATAEEKARTAGRDERVMKGVPDRSRRVQAPDTVAPKGRFAGAAQAVEAFRARRDRTIRFIETTPADLRAHHGPHPFLGPLDAYQWVLFLAAHTDRHLQQMREIVESPGFPGGR